MKIIVSKYSGFCGGAEKSLKTVIDAVRSAQGKPVLTLGPLLHNRQVVDSLKEKGVEMIARIEEAPAGAVLVLRAHGTPAGVMAAISTGGFVTFDATCEKVKRIHKIIDDKTREGAVVFLLGEKGHAEVEGHLSRGESNIYLITQEKDIPDGLGTEADVVVISQTSFGGRKYERMCRSIMGKYPQAECIDTLCGWMEAAQSAAEQIAKDADVMIVIGGKESANTKRLFEKCGAVCRRTIHAEQAADIDATEIEGAEIVGITGGASTPLDEIESIVCLLKERFGAEVADIV